MREEGDSELDAGNHHNPTTQVPYFEVVLVIVVTIIVTISSSSSPSIPCTTNAPYNVMCLFISYEIGDDFKRLIPFSSHRRGHYAGLLAFNLILTFLRIE